MSHPNARPTARRRLMGSALLAASLTLGLGSAAVTARAQPVAANPPEPPRPAATPSSNDPLGEVTVEGARRDPLRNIPPEKRAEFDAEVAKQDAFRRYRGSTPTPAADNKGISDPNDLSADFPGVGSYVPK